MDEILMEILEDNVYEAFPNISDLNVWYSLSSCQGDGVSFTGIITSDDNITEFLTKVYGVIPNKIKRVIPHIYSISFERTEYHYTHAYTVETTIIDQWNDSSHTRFLNLLDDIEQDIEKYRIETCRELEKIGYEYLEEEEND